MEINLELLVGKMKALVSDLTHDKTMLECCIEQKDAEIKQLRSSLVAMAKEVEDRPNSQKKSELYLPKREKD